MYIDKVKTYDNISLSDLKGDLRIFSGDTTYDAELSRLIKSAVAMAEHQIGCDIVYTISTLVDYDVCGAAYQIDNRGLSISAITITNHNVTTTITGYTIQKFYNYTFVKFQSSISADILNIVYTSGNAGEIEPDIIRAITIKVSELLDVDKSGYVSSSVKESKAFERILAPHMILY